MALKEKILFIIVSVVVLYLFIRFLAKLLRQSRVRLSSETKSRADEVFDRLIYQFEERYERRPNRNEKFRRAINTSHIVERRRGWSGHWHRQKIRKYLLEKNRVVRNFKMR